MFLLFVFFLLHTTETSGEVCPEEKKVGDICYTRVAMTDTQQYGCKENCTYKKTNSSDTTQYCFQKGDLQVTKCGICQSGWEEFNGRCYYFSSDRKARSWNQARAECTGLNLGADLASIGSKEDEDYIARNAGDPIWILLGGTDADTEGQWRWTDGRPWVYSGWRNGDPKGGTVENCLTMKNPDWDKFWNDGPCDFIYEPSPLICSYKPDKGCLDCLRDDCPQCVPPCTGVGCQDCVMANCLRECGSDPCNPQ